MICENCNTVHDGTYGSGRFCGKNCARSFSTKNKRDDINKKVSERLKGRKLPEYRVEKLKGLWQTEEFRSHIRGRKRQQTGNILAENSEYSTKYVKEILLKENIKEYVCEECGITNYNNKEITLQLHHKNGIRTDQRLENLQLLCPNCHSQTDNYAGKKGKRTKK